ncbi:ABC transporter permease [Paenibacillus thermotolerans]|uniref:ABC transporter permease n=1 Tax=Paenibacillus thermotolerans TaxID=3027807 RepID=UPI002368D1F5|nr:MULTISPECIES: FtsX-like permease family protein [unclassified Paenibacillus]
MFKAALIWRMAWRNLAAQRRQTVLTLLGGSIGVMLTVAAVVFLSAFDHSGMRWLRDHYGSINWELKPASNQSFTSAQVKELADRLKGSAVETFPSVTFTASVFTDSGSSDTPKAAADIFVIGIDPESPLIPNGYRQAAMGDRVIVSRPVADMLLLREGDVLGIEDHQGLKKLYKVSAIAEEQGLTGYRGSGRSGGTIITDEAAARSLAGVPEGEFNTIFASDADGPDISLDTPHFPVYFSDLKYVVMEPKRDAIYKIKEMKTGYGTTFLIASGFAVAAGLILMRELLMMLADQRRERFGVLRALGFSRRHIRQIFMAEATVLNGCAALIGTVLGSLLGYGMVWLFRLIFLNTLQKFATMEVPITPYISFREVFVSAICIFAANGIVALMTGRSVSRLSIVSVLRGQTGELSGRHRKLNWQSVIMQTAAGLILTSFAYLLFSGKAVEQLGKVSLTVPIETVLVLLNWVLAPLALLYLFSQGMHLLQIGIRAALRMLRVPAVPALLALRYPLLHRRRVFSVSSLFALVFLIMSMVLSIGNMALSKMEKEAQAANVIGYPAYIPYADEKEKNKLLQLIGEHERIRSSVRAWHAVEPYRLNVDAPGIFKQKFAMSIVAPDENYLRTANVPLVSRISSFESDAEVWEALRENPDAVVLHETFMYSASDWPGNWGYHNLLPEEAIKPGDEIELNLYPKPRLGLTEEEEKADMAKRKVKVLGFVRAGSGIEFYSLMMVSPTFYEDYRERGFQWENTQHLGYVLLDVETSDLDGLQRLEEQFLLNGVSEFRMPGVDTLARAALLRHTFSIYTSFMTVSVIIGIIGLAIVQVRAALERSKQLGMLRCIGVNPSHIVTMFLVEGSMIGWAGLLTGWLFGSVGGFLIYQLQQYGASPLDVELGFEYPAGILLGLLVSFMLIAMIVNVIPARRSIAVSPGIAVRAAD